VLVSPGDTVERLPEVPVRGVNELQLFISTPTAAIDTSFCGPVTFFGS
jgi:hypothetical protein